MATIQKYKTKSGEFRWRVRYWMDGEQRSKSFDMQGKAKDFKAKVEHESRIGSYIEPSKMTVGGLLDIWLEEHKARVRDISINNYEQQVKNIKRFIADVKLQKLTPAQIEKMYIDFKKDRKPGTVYYMHRILKMALKYAFKARLININPCDLVDAPKKGKHSVKTIEYADISKYLACAKDSWVYPAVCLAMFTGMRREEIYALDWDHVDFANESILVEKVQNVIKGKLVETSPKNHEARKIILPKMLSELLKSLQTKQYELRLKGEYQRDCLYTGRTNNYVITQPGGVRPVPRTITRVWQECQAKAKLSVVTFHSLKHTAATLMEYSGVDLRIASDLLAHKSVDFTNRVYRYIFEEQMNEAKQALNSHMSKNFSL